MSETVTVLEELGIIEVISVGALQREVMGRSLSQCVELRLFKELRRVLVDVRETTSSISATGMHEFAQAIAAQPVLQDVRFAIVARSEPGTDLRLLENTARNRGVQMRLFAQRQDALDWLVAK